MHDQQGISNVRLVFASINLGGIPYFSKDVVLPFSGDVFSVRSISYHLNNTVDEFPLLFCASSIEVALEMNLFMCHRYEGKHGSPKKGRNDDPISGVVVKTVKSIANSMRGYLAWLTKNGIGFPEIYAIADSDKTKPWLPAWRYRAYLISLLDNKKLTYSTAVKYLGHVRLFYAWALMQRRINSLPFTYKTVYLTRSRKDGDADFLFENAQILNNKYRIQTSDLSIPKKYNIKNAKDKLMPFVKQEIDWLFNSQYMQQTSRRLWAELACVSGFRADDVAQFPEDLVVNPSLTVAKVYPCKITGKNNKARTILIPAFLMESLWQYKNSPDRLRRAAKWDQLYGTEKPRNLFINRSGRPVQSASISNTTGCVRKELKTSGIAFKRKFHDLRSTFATTLCKYMMDKGLPIGFIQSKLMQLMGHENFSTTLKYINLARDITFELQMLDWVDHVYADLKPILEKEAEGMANEVTVV